MIWLEDAARAQADGCTCGDAGHCGLCLDYAQAQAAAERWRTDTPSPRETAKAGEAPGGVAEEAA